VADGRQIRPADEPTPAKVSFDWRHTVCEALVRNVDLRRQKWRVKEKELELISAKNYVLPRLDAVGQYRWRGLGNDYWGTARTPGEFDNAMQNLTGGDFQDWQFGLEFSLPIGFRKQLAGVRHAQLNLARERSVLREQELEVSHQLGSAIRDLELGTKLIRTNYEYYVAAKHEVAAIQAAYDNGTITLNVLLEAQRRAAEAEIAYYRSLVNYNLAIVDVHFRKGSLLEYNGIWLAEGPWVGKAYFDARRRAVARDAGLYMDYGFTRPKVISRGAYQQHVCPGRSAEPCDGPFELEPAPMVAPTPELLDPPTAPVIEGSSRSARPAGPRLSDAARPAPSAGETSAVRLVSHYDETTPADEAPNRAEENPPETAASAGWKNVHRTSTPSQTTNSGSHESDSHPTSAQRARAASGWKGM
jgi:hypothetical protein